MSLRRFAIVTASCTFLLLLMGGLVHNTRSSLACPDWPLCFGQVFPKMEGGVLVEHSHRLVAATVTLLAFALMIGCWRRATRTRDAGLAKAGALAFALVLTQALLGGITVIYRLPTMVLRNADPERDAAACAAIYAPYVSDSVASFEARPPGVRESAVVGPDRVHAVLVLEPGANEDAIVRAANAALEEHQKIRGVSVWPETELPRTEGTGKLKRREVQQWVAGGVGPVEFIKLAAALTAPAMLGPLMADDALAAA